MRKHLLWGAMAIAISVGMAACEPYYDGNGYYGRGFNGYGPNYGYGYGPAPYGAPAYQPAPMSYVVPQSLSQLSYNFVINSALSDNYEIEAGQMAAQKSASPQVRQFAGQMVRDHTMTTQQMAMVLQTNGTPVVTPAALDPRHQAMIGDLTAAQGAEFDRRYAAQQVAAHQDAVTMVQNYAQNGDNAALRQLAAQMLPLIQDHLRMARMLPGASG